jgi:hypothetical protein
MNNFFLFNPALMVENLQYLILGFEKLIPIENHCEEYDHLYKRSDIWNLELMMELFSETSQSSAAIIKFIEQLSICNLTSFEEPFLDQKFPEMLNAFLGIDFSVTSTTLNRQITNLDAFYDIRKKYLWDLEPISFWKRRKILFPSLNLCGEVEDQVKMMGMSRHFSQLIEKLAIFNSAVKLWKDGSFNYKETNREFALNISPESRQTMSKYGNERLFSLPNGDRKYFELHIKTGDLRFHFYPDTNTHQVFIGYIGPHLTIASS